MLLFATWGFVNHANVRAATRAPDAGHLRAADGTAIHHGAVAGVPRRELRGVLPGLRRRLRHLPAAGPGRVPRHRARRTGHRRRSRPRSSSATSRPAARGAAPARRRPATDADRGGARRATLSGTLNPAWISTSSSSARPVPCPPPRRITSATLIRRGGERMLVDCGEGAQRRLMQSAAGLADIELILLTHAHTDHYLGPAGAPEDLRPARAHGAAGAVRAARHARPGGVDGSRSSGGSSFPFVVIDLAAGEEVACDGYRLTAVPTVHRGPSCGWSLVEDDRPGRFDVDEARRRGVPEGPLFGRLQHGEDVELADGTVVRAAEIVGEDRIGRRIVISGDTRPCDGVLAASLGRRPADPRGDLPRRRVGARARDAALDGAGGGGAGRRGGRRDARADPSLDPVRAAGRQGGGARDLREQRTRPAISTRSSCPFASAANHVSSMAAARSAPPRRS